MKDKLGQEVVLKPIYMVKLLKFCVCHIKKNMTPNADKLTKSATTSQNLLPNLYLISQMVGVRL